jgi:hypothetical protein
MNKDEMNVFFFLFGYTKAKKVCLTKEMEFEENVS